MNNIHEYYDNVTEISVLTKEAIKSVKIANEKVQQALYLIKSLKKHNDTAISPVTNITTNEVHHNLLFFELLLNQTLGVTNTLIFQELLLLTSYLSSEEDW
jgi:hypothetical protein